MLPWLDTSAREGQKHVALGMYGTHLPLSERAMAVRDGQFQMANDDDYARNRALKGALAGAAAVGVLAKTPRMIRRAVRAQQLDNLERNTKNLAFHAHQVFNAMPEAQQTQFLGQLSKDVPYWSEVNRGGMVDDRVPPGIYSVQGMEGVLRNMQARSFAGAPAKANAYFLDTLRTAAQQTPLTPQMAKHLGGAEMATTDTSFLLGLERIADKLQGVDRYLSTPVYKSDTSSMLGLAANTLASRANLATLGAAAPGAAVGYFAGKRDQRDLEESSLRDLESVEAYLRDRDNAEARKRAPELSQGELEGRLLSKAENFAAQAPLHAAKAMYLADLGGLVSNPIYYG